MRLEALRYDSKAGWSVAPFPELDSSQTLVVIFGGTEFLDDQTAIATVKQASESFAAGQELAKKLAEAGENLRGVFVLSDGLHVNGSELVKGLNGGLPPAVVITGGLAGDRDRFSRTWVINRA